MLKKFVSELFSTPDASFWIAIGMAAVLAALIVVGVLLGAQMIYMVVLLPVLLVEVLTLMAWRKVIQAQRKIDAEFNRD